MPEHHPPTSATVYELVPMAHVVDVEASIRFYELLGFQVRDRLTHGPRTRWAWLHAGKGHLMLAAADGAIPADQQAILLYLYTRDVAALRAHLLASGLTDGGAFHGDPSGRRGVVHQVTHPPHMLEGEIRVVDPDGYILLIGQCEVRT